MEGQNLQLPTRWVSIYQNTRVTSFQSLSGYRIGVPDADGIVRNVPIDASDAELGVGMQEALDRSRLVPLDGTRQFLYWHEEIDRVWKLRLDQLARDSGFSSRRGIFKGLRYCSATVRQGEIEFVPTRRIRGDAWQDLRMAPILIAEGVEAPTLGAAVRAAMEACQG